MTIHRGTGTIKRTHASNYIGLQAGKRLREVVDSAQAKGLQALQVDSFEVAYYHRVDCATPCTCRTTLSTPETSGFSTRPGSGQSLPPNIRPSLDSDEIVIDHSTPLFGTANTQTESIEDIGHDMSGGGLDAEQLEEDGSTGNDSLFGAGVDCGICYRSGLVPGYERYGSHRILLTTHDIADVYGYSLNKQATPHIFESVDPEGYVLFKVELPSYITGARFSIRNNHSILSDEYLSIVTSSTEPKGEILTLQHLLDREGTTVTLSVQAACFTHVVLEIDLGSDPILANLSQASIATDWTLFDRFGTVSIVLPMTIANVANGDVIHVPSTNTAFKISDFPLLRTAEGRNIDWLVSCRVLQPQECLKNIFVATDLL